VLVIVFMMLDDTSTRYLLSGGLLTGPTRLLLGYICFSITLLYILYSGDRFALRWTTSSFDFGYHSFTRTNARVFLVSRTSFVHIL
jgi:hypothetical protein